VNDPTTPTTRDLDKDTVTSEVGDEGGSPADVEIADEQVTGTGSEAGETWRPADDAGPDNTGDVTGEGRRSP
jgi:hypothetical protein